MNNLLHPNSANNSTSTNHQHHKSHLDLPAGLRSTQRSAGNSLTVPELGREGKDRNEGELYRAKRGGDCYVKLQGSKHGDGKGGWVPFR